MGWLQGRSEIAFRSQKPLHLHGDVSVAADRFAIDAMKAEIDGGTVAGRIAVSKKSAGGGSRFDAELKADRLDLDAATAFVRALAGPQAEWPDAGAAIARFRPRGVGRPGTGAAAGKTGLRPERRSRSST